MEIKLSHEKEFVEENLFFDSFGSAKRRHFQFALLCLWFWFGWIRSLVERKGNQFMSSTILKSDVASRLSSDLSCSVTVLVQLHFRTKITSCHFLSFLTA